jgi:glycosyltransferase involved in cell wall biosynthesis
MSSQIKRVVFWQNILSIHQSAFVRALAARPGMEVWFAYEEDLSDSRKTMGWTVPDYGAARLADSRDAARWAELVTMDDAATCHAFGSYFHLPRAGAAFGRLRRCPCRRAWTTEAFEFHGWRGWVRLQRARWHVFREALDAFHCVFAMGNLGVRFFRRAGVRPEQLREFAYLVEPPQMPPVETKPPNAGSAFRFLFVGQLIRRKGVDLLLRAVSQLPQSGWRLDLIGNGPDREALMALAGRCGISSRVRFMGNQPNQVTLTAIRSADVLVLPSRWDGWGAVVNEALMLGTPTIVSNACGAASLVINDTCGSIFRSNDEKDLERALRSALERKTIVKQRRDSLRSWAGVACGAPALVAYFLSCLKFPPHSQAKLPPWRETIGPQNLS